MTPERKGQTMKKPPPPRFNYATYHTASGQEAQCEIIAKRLEHPGSNIEIVSARVLPGQGFVGGDLFTAPSLRFTNWRHEP